jgi:hypothetical protein
MNKQLRKAPSAENGVPDHNLMSHLVEALMLANGWEEVSKAAEFLGESPMTVARWRKGGWVSFPKLEEAVARAGGDIWRALPPHLRPREAAGSEPGCEVVGRVHADKSFVVLPSKKPRRLPLSGLESIADPARWALGQGPPVLFDTDGGRIQGLPPRSLLVARAFAGGKPPEDAMLVVEAANGATRFLVQRFQAVEAGGAVTTPPEPSPQPTFWQPSDKPRPSHIVCGVVAGL